MLLRVPSALIAALVILSPAGRPADAAKKIRVGVVLDGPSAQGDAWVAQVESSLSAVLRADFDLEFPADGRVTGDWTGPGVKTQLRAVLSNPNIDLVVALGVLSSDALVKIDSLPKPAIAALLLDIETQGAPFSKGRSARKNLNYLITPGGIQAELDELIRVVESKHAVVLVEDGLVGEIPDLDAKLALIGKDRGVEVSVYGLGKDIDASLTSIPEGVDAVILSPLLSLDDEAAEHLLEVLNLRKLPSLDAFRRSRIDEGALLATAPSDALARRARRLALHVQRILGGEGADTLPVVFPQERHLVINMATARKIGFYPKWSVLTEAELIHSQSENVDRVESLATVAQEALKANLDLQANEQRVLSSEENIALARSGYLPNAGVHADGTWIDADRATNSFGILPERSLSVGGTLNQRILDEPTFARITVNKRRQKSVEAERESLRLDIVREAAVAYLNVLRAKTFERIQRENLQLTRKNLSLAQLRQSTGVAGANEVYRWEAEIARGQQTVTSASAVRNQAEIALNRVVNRQLEDRFGTQEPDIDAPELMLHQLRLKKYLDNPWGFKVYRSFMVEEAVQASPEIRRVDALMSAQERALSSSSRRLWLPTLGFGATLDYWLLRGGAGSSPAAPIPGASPSDNLRWRLGLNADFPLFTGLERLTSIRQGEYEVAKIRLERDALVQRVEQRIRSALHQAGASFSNIRLAQEGAEATKKNLDYVSEEYSRGAAPLILLVDAQNTYLNAQLTAANVVYDFLVDWMDVQRAAASFSFLLAPEEVEAAINRFETYYDKARSKGAPSQ